MRISKDGWVSFPGPAELDGLHVRVRADGDRLVITDLFVHGSALDSEALRKVSISRLEAALNAPDDDHLGRTLEAQAKLAREGRTWSDDDLTLPKLRGRAPREDKKQRRRERLSRPDGKDPENFYRAVAFAYGEYAISTNAPAKELAEEAQVPVTAAHRWIREARRRGFLPAARKGKAG